MGDSGMPVDTSRSLRQLAGCGNEVQYHFAFTVLDDFELSRFRPTK